MNRIFSTALLITAISWSACTDNSAASNKNNKGTADTVQMSATTPDKDKTVQNNPLAGMTAAYLDMKNGLAGDNGNEAAAAGTKFNTALDQVNKSMMSAGQRKSFEDIADDAREMAEHISTNAGKIAHQREHFDMLSKDMYDLLKAFGTGQHLYADYCPMYNNNKGAVWLSETKTIKNPYMGKQQPDCGTVKEELK
jgi:hypothetical protein